MINPKHAIERMTTLWAVSECGLGGFFHAIRSPFTGLIVGGISVICISLIAFFALQLAAGQGLRSRFKAIMLHLPASLLFVLAVKMAVSPHSPIGAHVAVSMQALFGMVFFTLVPSYRISAMLCGIMGALGSAFQKIIFLVILFGSPFWDAFDAFVSGIVEYFSSYPLPPWISASWTLAALFVAIYFVGGALVGYSAGKIPSWLRERQKELENAAAGFIEQNPIISPDAPKKRMFPWIFTLFLSLLVVAFVFEFVFLSAEAAIHQLVRTLVIIAIWFILVHPLLRWLLRKLTANESAQWSERITTLRNAIPDMAARARYSWQRSLDMPGYRLTNFALLMIFFGLRDE